MQQMRCGQSVVVLTEILSSSPAEVGEDLVQARAEADVVVALVLHLRGMWRRVAMQNGPLAWTQPQPLRPKKAESLFHGDGVWVVGGRDALERNGPQRRPQKRLDRRLEEAAKAVGGGCCRLQMPLKPALGVRETVAGHRLGAREGGGGGGGSSPSNASLGGGVLFACQDCGACHTNGVQPPGGGGGGSGLMVPVDGQVSGPAAPIPWEPVSCTRAGGRGSHGAPVALLGHITGRLLLLLSGAAVCFRFLFGFVVGVCARCWPRPCSALRHSCCVLGLRSRPLCAIRCKLSRIGFSLPENSVFVSFQVSWTFFGKKRFSLATLWCLQVMQRRFSKGHSRTCYPSNDPSVVQKSCCNHNTPASAKFIASSD